MTDLELITERLKNLVQYWDDQFYRARKRSCDDEHGARVMMYWQGYSHGLSAVLSEVENILENL